MNTSLNEGRILKYESTDAEGYPVFSTPTAVNGSTKAWASNYSIGQCWYASVGVKYMFEGKKRDDCGCNNDGDTKARTVYVKDNRELDGYALRRLLIKEPQLADTCDLGKLGGRDWYYLLLKRFLHKKYHDIDVIPSQKTIVP